MLRRTFLSCLATATLGLGWKRFAAACGESAEHFEEEFLDLAEIHSDNSTPLSHFYSVRLNARFDERFCVGTQGRGLVFADVDSFDMMPPNGQLLKMPAMDGDQLVLDTNTSTIILKLHSGSSYEKLVVANPITGAHEFWGDAFALRQVAPSAAGLVVAHGRLESTEGRLSVITGPGQMRERIRLELIPAYLCALGNQVAYFLDQTAYCLDVTKSDAPKVLGRLSAAPSASVLTPSGLFVTTDDGAWRMPFNSVPYRLASEKDLMFLFARGKTVVIASARRALILEGQSGRTIEAPNSNLHFIGPIEGSNDLVICKGPSIYGTTTKLDNSKTSAMAART